MSSELAEDMAYLDSTSVTQPHGGSSADLQLDSDTHVAPAEFPTTNGNSPQAGPVLAVKDEERRTTHSPEPQRGAVASKDEMVTHAAAEKLEQAEADETRLSSNSSSRPPTVSASVGNAFSHPVPSTSQSAKLEEFINSPRGQNAIVERSPGGRYVRFLEKLGSGASKDVYRAYDTTEGIEVAWNVVNLSGVPKTERNRIVNEVRLLERLHHQNIISFHGSWVNRERQEVNFVTEILSSGTLKSFINKVQVIRWKIAKRWAVQILKGLEYLHSQDPPVIHRDLKCENIFINGTSGDLRIGDLGLSTVHRNGKVLSVLGTPEFMAPDLYEEASYDEKVDIYAFGMCLLEIFTKEIPYRECSNPAQIYKKVLKGEPPESLSRVRSPEARDFIMLCLGNKGESGEYVRPSASELLVNGFLAKSVDDDSEVEIDPPMQERVISEASEESFSSELVGRPKKLSDNPDESFKSLPSSVYRDQTGPNAENEETPKSATVGMPLSSHMNPSPDEDDSDKFSEMPVSEVNIKKVKVLMGRGQELEDNNNGQSSGLETVHLSSLNRTEDSPDGSHRAREIPELSFSLRSDSGGIESGRNADMSPPHYLVAAAVIEEESPLSRPYPDDMLKLIVTLPVEGQNQNVQFDFHLVQDDPVKVAKEMVMELNIPQEAVLEISETISGLACSARMKQDKYNSHQKEVAHNKPLHNQGTSLGQTEPGEHAQVSQMLKSGKEGPNIATPVLEIPASTTPPSQTRTSQNHPQSHEAGTIPSGDLQQQELNSQQAIMWQPLHSQKTGLGVGAAISGQDARETKSDTSLPGKVPLEGECAIQPSSPLPSDAPTPATQLSEQCDSLELEGSVGDAETESDGESELTEELRLLDENFQKNLLRAQKVFDNRMDSLHRSKEEKEAQHLKTLEKHEKERAEFEKRLEAEAKEQSRRIQQLQLEWDRRRESIAKQRDTKKQEDLPGYLEEVAESIPGQESGSK